MNHVLSRDINLFSAGMDYVAVNVAMVFEAEETVKTFLVRILDDLGHPKLEGVERFELLLRMPMNGTIGRPNKAIIAINDTITDCKLNYM